MSCGKARVQNTEDQHSRIRTQHLQVPAAQRWLGLCLVSLLTMGCSSSDGSETTPSDAVSDNGSAGTTVTQTDETSTSETSTVDSAVPPSLFNNAQILPVSATTQLGGETIELEVTRTIQEQAKGLMFREKLPDNRGMLFAFDPPRIARFWMKNVVIDLDMVFLHEGTIVAIAADVPPCTSDPCPTYGPVGKLVDTVIELRGGRAAELGLKAGDAVVISPIETTTDPTTDPTTEASN